MRQKGQEFLDVKGGGVTTASGFGQGRSSKEKKMCGTLRGGGRHFIRVNGTWIEKRQDDTEVSGESGGVY